jgi:rifampicin phosphotransferase
LVVLLITISQGANLETIRQLVQIGRADTTTVGSKAAALGELLRAGFNVPDGFVLTTAAYAQMIESLRDRIETRVTPDVINDPAEVETAAGQVREWIETEPWTASLRAELAAALGDRAGAQSFAARTSLPSEELATAFGAGVQRAALGLVGLDNVERGAAQCWGALWTSRSMYYRHRKKIPQTLVALAVLVQPMVPAQAAGVMFTSSPATNDRDELQIDSIWGLGAPLTQARVHPDRFLVGKADGVIRERQVEEKTVQLVVRADGSLEQETVAAANVEAPSSSDAQVIELARVGKKIEQFLGEPQDIEWARVGDELFILQARPIALRTS